MQVGELLGTAGNRHAEYINEHYVSHSLYGTWYSSPFATPTHASGYVVPENYSSRIRERYSPRSPLVTTTLYLTQIQTESKRVKKGALARKYRKRR